MSKPRAATSVATNMWTLLAWKSAIILFLLSWEKPPCNGTEFMPLNLRFLATKSTFLRVLQKIMTRFDFSFSSRCLRREYFRLLSTS